tara:strand:+ start:113944 stop:114741 length:798 start_codon:yes stop_codon:yes gene_type:complete
VREDFNLPAPKPGADYLITVLRPEAPPPPEGYPVLYALDGRAVVEQLPEGAMARPGAPVIVAIGYDTERRFASAERARDYTPPDPDGRAVYDTHGRPAGGAAVFHDLITGVILPRAEALVPVDPARRTLWGHSFGGLFVLRSALQPEGAWFSHFVSASPSLWWDDMRYRFAVHAALALGARPSAPLDLHLGGAERERASLPPGEDVKPFIRMRAALPPDSHAELAADLARAGNPGGLTVFPGLSHGEAFGASLRETLRGFAGTGG